MLVLDFGFCLDPRARTWIASLGLLLRKRILAVLIDMAFLERCSCAGAAQADSTLLFNMPGSTFHVGGCNLGVFFKRQQPSPKGPGTQT